MDTVTPQHGRMPGQMLFGAGTIHRGLRYENGVWNFEATWVGETLGGSRCTIVPEIRKIEADGAPICMMGLSRKVGETAKMEIHFASAAPYLLKTATLGQWDEEAADANAAITSSPCISLGDYWDNVAFVGHTVGGQRVIVVMENALCVSGMEIHGAAEQEAILKCTFECYARVGGLFDRLPWHIYYFDNGKDE